MSVDYYACSCCGDAIYEEGVVSCEKCGRTLCRDCMTNCEHPRGEFYIPGEYCNDDGELLSQYCPFCSGKVVDDGELVEFLLKKIGMSRAEAVEEFKASHNHNI